MRETRLDYGASTIGKIRTTSQGFLAIPATLTRTGVLTYTRSDGTTVKELRHPDEVFKAESLETMTLAPVTDGHPGLVNPNNVGDVSIGIVSKAPAHDGNFVTAEILVQRKDGIEGVQAKRLKEVSPGYTCSIDPTPGVWEGERYDQVQKDIVYNHVALGPVGWGRSGPEVSLRFDGVSGAEPVEPIVAKQETSTMAVHVTLEGVDYELDLPDKLAKPFESSFNKLRQDAADSKAKVEELEGALEAAKKNADELQARYDSATSVDALAKAVKEYSETLKKAESLTTEVKFDGLSVAEIKTETLKANGFDAESLEGKSASFIDGAFAALRIPEKKEAGNDLPFHAPKAVERQDGEVKKTESQSARDRMVERLANAWKGEEYK